MDTENSRQRCVEFNGHSCHGLAIGFDSLTCEQCDENAVEHLIRLHEGKKLCLDCFERYTRGW